MQHSPRSKPLIFVLNIVYTQLDVTMFTKKLFQPLDLAKAETSASPPPTTPPDTRSFIQNNPLFISVKLRGDLPDISHVLG